MTIKLHGTKQKEETHGLIAKAWGNAELGAEIEIIQPNDLGGKSLEKILLKNFPDANSESKKKSRFITLTKSNDTPAIIDEWVEHTKLRLIRTTGFHSMPGLFGWNKIDVGSRLLSEHLPNLKGTGADFGCGYGFLTRHVLTHNADTTTLYALDYDVRAVEACTKNIIDDRVVVKQADCTSRIDDLKPLDFVVMNPPFHDGATEDRDMGQKFIETAARHLRSKGRAWIVANKHMPYEKTIEKNFKSYEKIIEQNGFKILKCIK
jgi:16S rRNA (guanine1207-N2)-methyltransferase